MWHCAVVWVATDVSEHGNAFIFYGQAVQAETPKTMPPHPGLPETPISNIGVLRDLRFAQR